MSVANLMTFLNSTRALSRSGQTLAALNLLRKKAKPNDSMELQFQYARLARDLSEDMTDLPILRVAFLAGSTLDHLTDCMRFWLLLEGFRVEFYIAPFNTWRQEAMDINSGLYAFRPDIVWFFLTARDINLCATAGAPAENIAAIVSKAADDLAAVVKHVISRLPALIIVNNAEGTATRTFGNFEGATLWSQASLLRQYNLALTSVLPFGTTIFDLEHIANCFGLDRWDDFRLWCHSKHAFTLDAIGPVAFAVARLLAASRGRTRKCVVLDLDNTLWGGVVGDDGVDGIRIGPSDGSVGEAFLAFQSYLKKLSERGIALAVCSKNDPKLAEEPFRIRSEMILKRENFAVFRVNWENKADNLRSIAAEMNLGLDALVYIDDNAAERALITAELPEVAVPEMPADPSDYVRALAMGAWFETLTFSDEDRHRSQAYQENAARHAARSQITDIEAYLRDLEMHATWGDADAANLPRLAQLVNKTNQFHLTTTRYSELELKSLVADRHAWVGSFSLRDRFGDHGVIAAVVLRFSGETASIDSWAMSCRVFSRGMEDFIFAKLWTVAKSRGCSWLEGCYRPTAKNAVVAKLYDRFGGTLIESSATERKWRFNLVSSEPPTFGHITE